MKKAQIRNEGDQQVILLPKGVRFEGTVLLVEEHGRCITLVPEDAPWLVEVEMPAGPDPSSPATPAVVALPDDIAREADPWKRMFAATTLFSEDFMAERDQGCQPEREPLD